MPTALCSLPCHARRARAAVAVVVVACRPDTCAMPLFLGRACAAASLVVIEFAITGAGDTAAWRVRRRIGGVVVGVPGVVAHPVITVVMTVYAVFVALGVAGVVELVLIASVPSSPLRVSEVRVVGSLYRKSEIPTITSLLINIHCYCRAYDSS